MSTTTQLTFLLKERKELTAREHELQQEQRRNLERSDSFHRKQQKKVEKLKSEISRLQNLAAENEKSVKEQEGKELDTLKTMHENAVQHLTDAIQ